MPIGDIIFERLRAARPAELAAFGNAIGLSELSGDRDVDIVALSREFRSASGNSLANVFRRDHDLAYRDILLDVATAASNEARWPNVQIPPHVDERRIEDFIFTAMSMASRSACEDVSDVERAKAFEEAVTELAGTPSGPGIPGEDLGAAAMLALAFVVNPALAFGAVALRRIKPNRQKGLAATMILIHIHRRQAAEQDLLAVVAR